MRERFDGSMQHIQSSSCPICELRAQQQAEKGCPMCALRNQQPNRMEQYAGLVEAVRVMIHNSETVKYYPETMKLWEDIDNLKAALGRVKG